MKTKHGGNSDPVFNATREQIHGILRQSDRGSLHELEMEALVLSAMFGRGFSVDDVLEVRVFIARNLCPGI